MDLSRLNARLAPRSCWQAMDLGTRLYRRWWRQGALVWLTFTLLPFALLAGIAAAERTFWPLLVFWWFKPLWERPLLAFYSRALFADYPGPGELVRGFPGYGLNGLLAQLTWRRLSPARGFLTGVWQLEGSRGERVPGRIAVLLRPPGQRPATLTAMVLALEHLMTLALVVLVFTLLPWEFNLELSVWFGEQSHLHWVLGNLLWYLVLTVTEPLYMATSLALYLNQRTWLEGWDLQLGLGRIGARRRGIRRPGSSPGLALALAVGLTAWPALAPLEAHADEPADAKQEAVELLASDTFMPMEVREERRLKDSPDGGGDWIAWLDRLLNAAPERRDSAPLSIPPAVLYGLGALLLLGLLVVVIRALSQAKTTPRPGPGPVTPPVSVAGLDTRADSLPGDPLSAAGQALEQGRIRDALSLLLRDTLVTLFHHHPLALPPGATERDCVRGYRRALNNAEPARFLERLATAWSDTAWAHRPPDRDQVGALLTAWRQLRPQLADRRRGARP